MNATKAILLALIAGVATTAAAVPFPYPYPEMAREYVHISTGRFQLFEDLEPEYPGGRLAPPSPVGPGPGWVRTGYSMEIESAGPGGRTLEPVCHFVSPATGAHFYTLAAGECGNLKSSDSGWAYRGIAFEAASSRAGCGDWSPVYRLYNNRWMFDDSMHRYTPDVWLRARLIREGWVDEGIAFCTPNWEHPPPFSGFITSPRIATGPECDAGGKGVCFAVNYMPALSNTVDAFVELWPSRTTNPGYPGESHSVTGLPPPDLYAFWVRLATAQAIDNPSAVAAHSYVQAGGSSGMFGIHVNSADRQAGDYASINPRVQLVTPAAVWGGARNPYLDISFWMNVQTLTRADAQSHAYGGPVVTFVDRGSGLSLLVAIVAYGTITPAGGEETAGRDAHTGRVMVATTFLTPSFGERIAGEWVSCSGAGGCALAEVKPYLFRLTRNAFAVALARARAVEPRFSAVVDNYELAGFEFRNEVYREGRIGLTLWDLRVDILGQ